jgi:2-furoyl-CoA dehydrogenase large subunit
LHGLAAVLHENIEYDSDGTPLTTSFVTYLAPTAYDVPSFRTQRIVIPSPFTPLGAKGVGEGCGAPIPAVVAAVEDALKTEITTSHLKPEDIMRMLASNQ